MAELDLAWLNKIEAGKVTPAEFVVLSHLVFLRSESENNVVRTTHRNISSQTGLSQGGVTKSILGLIKKGAILRLKQKNKPTLYLIEMGFSNKLHTGVN